MLAESLRANRPAPGEQNFVLHGHSNARKMPDPNGDYDFLREADHADIATADFGHRTHNPFGLHPIVPESRFFEKKGSRLFKPTYIIGVVGNLHLIRLIVLHFVDVF